MRRSLLALSLCLAACAAAPPPVYTPDWKSLDTRPTPAWFRDAKLGIFVHYGVYSVPAYTHRGGYAEWYYRGWKDRKPTSAVWQFHQRVYGADFPYEGFAPQFRNELWDPKAWVQLFERAGARYVVLTSKHHDGYCLWPSPHRPGWNSVDVGPKRDIVGDFKAAMAGSPMKFGLYYSLPEWNHPLYTWVYPRPENDVRRYVDEHMIPQLKDLVERYRPTLLWTDGEWDHNDKVWRAPELVSWLYNHPGLGPDFVTNDRWGSNTRFKHGGYYATEYTTGMKDTDHAWEECRGLGRSFGLNRNERAEDYKTASDLIHFFAGIVSEGGNLLLNVGPAADGTIPPLQEQRLLELGQWLKVNGPAIYGTRPWVFRSEGAKVRFTASADGRQVNAITLGWPGERLHLPSVKVRPGTQVRLLGAPEPVSWTYDVATGTTLHLTMAQRAAFQGVLDTAQAFQMEAESNVTAPPRVRVDGSPASASHLFVGKGRVTALCDTPGATLHATRDGSEPTLASPRLETLEVDRAVTLKVRAFHPERRPSPVAVHDLRPGEVHAGLKVRGLVQGLDTWFAQGRWPRLPDLTKEAQVEQGSVPSLGLESARRDEGYALSFGGYLEVPKAGVYTFHLASDDGSRLSLHGKVLIDHDGMHNDAETKVAPIVLGQGLHPFRLDYLQGGGGASLRLEVEGPGLKRQLIPPSWLRRTK